jgi:restriction system protein
MQSYKKLFTYWYALIIYDWTIKFCDTWITSYKLKEQMTGAARSGKQNIVEGADGMATSLKTAIKLSGVAKHSLEELLADYEDYLRQRGLKQWKKEETIAVESRKRIAKFVYSLGQIGDETAAVDKIKSVPFPKSRTMAANLLVTLCHQATYLLYKQVEALKNKHQREGGLTEELYRKRKEFRGY